MTTRTPRRGQWVRVYGQRIRGVLFELDPQTGIVRIKRRAEIEEVDLRCFGLRPLDNAENSRTIKEKQ